GAGRSVEHQQAARGTIRERVLGDTLGWQGVVEIRGPVAHGENWIADCGLRIGRPTFESAIRNPQSAIAYPSKMVCWSAVRGGMKPKCLYAAPVAQRPRGVRARKPRCMRNGSYTSSRVPGSSPTARGSGPGPPAENPRDAPPARSARASAA